MGLVCITGCRSFKSESVNVPPSKPYVQWAHERSDDGHKSNFLPALDCRHPDLKDGFMMESDLKELHRAVPPHIASKSKKNQKSPPGTV